MVHPSHDLHMTTAPTSAAKPQQGPASRQEAKIDKGTSLCRQCHQPFTPGAVMTSLLLSDEERGWKRVDYCTPCFAAAGTPSNLLALWRVHIEKPQARSVVLSEDAIWQVLRKAEGDAELREKPLLFILCLMLLRKRKLRVIRTRKAAGREYQTFSNMSRHVELEVMVPLLGPAAFASLQTEIGDFFKEAG